MKHLILLLLVSFSLSAVNITPKQIIQDTNYVFSLPAISVSASNSAQEATYGSADQVVVTETITEGTYLLIWTVAGNMNVRPTSGIGTTKLSIEVNSIEVIATQYFARWYPAADNGDIVTWGQTLTAYAVVPSGQTHTINCYLGAATTSGTPTNFTTRTNAGAGKLIGIRLK